MLVVHPSSTCDVCLEGYTWATPGNTPHAIACGHVFCLQCLQSTHPSHCPLCRKTFNPERIKKLHVDRLSTGGTNDATQESEILHRLAMVSGEYTPDEDVQVVLDDVEKWMSEVDEENVSDGAMQPRSHPVQNLFGIVRGRRELLQQHNRMQTSLQEQITKLTRDVAMREHDLRTSKQVEEGLLTRLQSTEDRYKSKIHQIEGDLTRSQVDFSRLQEENAQFRVKYMSASNPLPPPPQPVNSERLNSLTRPLASRSHTSLPPSTVGASSGAASTLSGGLDVAPLRPLPSEEREQDKGLRPPIMVPGSSKKVVPPREVENDSREIWSKEPPAEHHPDYTAHWAPSTINPTSKRSQRDVDVTSQRSQHDRDVQPHVNHPPGPESWPEVRPAPTSHASTERHRIYARAERDHPSFYERFGGPPAATTSHPQEWSNGRSQHQGHSVPTSLPRNDSSSSLNSDSNYHPHREIPVPAPIVQAPNGHILPPRITPPTIPPNAGQPSLPNGFGHFPPTNGVSDSATPSDGERSPASTWGTVITPRASTSSNTSLSLSLIGLPVAQSSSHSLSSSLNSHLGDLDIAGLPPASISGSEASSMNPSADDLRFPAGPHHIPTPSDHSSSESTSSLNNNSSAESGRPIHSGSSRVNLGQSESRTTDSRKPSSRKFSISDLNLIGLPGSSMDAPSGSNGSSSNSNTTTADPSPSASSRPIRPNVSRSTTETPSILSSSSSKKGEKKNRSRRVSFGPVAIAQPQPPVHPDPEEILTPRVSRARPIVVPTGRKHAATVSADAGVGGLGLSLGSGSSSTSTTSGHHVISDQTDLNIVDQSLMRLVNDATARPGSRARRQNRHSFSDVEGSPLLANIANRPSLTRSNNTAIYGSLPSSEHGENSPDTPHKPLGQPHLHGREVVNPMDRRSTSDSQASNSRATELGRSYDDTIRPKRHSSLNGSGSSTSNYQANGTAPMPQNQPSQNFANSKYANDDSASSSSRDSHRRQAPSHIADSSLSSATVFPSAVPPTTGSSLLLNFIPAGPGTSEARTASGEPSSIHAPRPHRGHITGHTTNIFGMWGSRTER